MELKINTTTKTIIVFNKVKLSELLKELDELNLSWEDWSIEIEPQVIRITEPCKKEDYDNPWINPSPWINPYNPITPLQPYYVGDIFPDLNKITCNVNIT